MAFIVVIMTQNTHLIIAKAVDQFVGKCCLAASGLAPAIPIKIVFILPLRLLFPNDGKCCARSKAACSGIDHRLGFLCRVNSAGCLHTHIITHGFSHQCDIFRLCPPVENPVEVFTKSAPASFANSHAFTFSSSVRRQVSMMTFKTISLPQTSFKV